MTCSTRLLELEQAEQIFAETYTDFFADRVNGIRIHLACIAGKGDWKYLRQAYLLATGYNCKDKCHLCDATDWYVLSKDAVWRGTINNRKETPHKSLDIPLLNVPGLRTELIYTDPMHTFHLGWGQDLAASGVILLAHLEYFGKGALDTRLERAYGEFVTYCSGVGRTTSCDGFSKQLFDMKSNNAFPTSLGGKAFDTSLVLAWLESFMLGLDIQHEILETLRYTVQCGNFFYRSLREHGVFIPHETRNLLVAAGQSME
ncbi:unnamed protein product, partial [Symbiodinium pilosum]